MRPGLLAVRATNQYRRRDVLAYLGLRYYLDSSAARSDRWAQEVATDLVLRSTEPCYLTVQHFKESDSLGRVTHRDIYLPGPNEALAEAALLDACARSGGQFMPAGSVYSYRLATADDLSGVYQHYMYGLQQRHEAIATMCRRSPDSEVLYLDIRQFYPSVTISRAFSAWRSAAESQGLSRGWIDVGLKLLDAQSRASAKSKGQLLIGPMLSHLVGNLLLRQVDQAMSQLPIGYCRYVDDITLVGTAAQIKTATLKLEESLHRLDLSLHGEGSAKRLLVPARSWLEGAEDFVEPDKKVSWVSLIGELKRLLVLSPELRESLVNELAENDIRLPVPDYTAAAQERSYKSRLSELFNFSWFRESARKPSIQSILSQAIELRNKYSTETKRWVEEIDTADAFLTKRLLPKIRYGFGRLAYLGDLGELRGLSDTAKHFPRLAFHSAVARSIATGDVSEILNFGVNAAQAVSQPLSMRTTRITFNNPNLNASAQQALSVLRMNGLSPQGPPLGDTQSQLLKLSTSGVDRSMMQSSEPFVRELACLHGLNDVPRHQTMLNTAFDTDEEIAFDAIEQEHQSS